MRKIKYQFMNSGGFTLIELLVAAIIGTIAVAAGFQLFIDQNKSHLIQANLSDMQQNGRSALDEIVEKIRQAGYRVPNGVRCIRSWDTNPDSIGVSYLAEPLCTTRLSQAMASSSEELKCVTAGVNGFTQDTWAYIHDAAAGTGEFFYITAVQDVSKQIAHGLSPLSKSYPNGSQVFMMNYVKYYVDNSDTLHPKLMISENGQDPVIYSDNIENLQFHYVQASGSVMDTVTVDRYVREIEIQLTARTEKNDLFMNDYRRDTLSTRVMIRNLGM